jgi:hypothetical protein
LPLFLSSSPLLALAKLVPRSPPMARRFTIFSENMPKLSILLTSNYSRRSGLIPLDVSFINPLGEEHGFDDIEQHVFQNVMGGMFSSRDLQIHNLMIYVNGDSAWSEFHWDFQATMRKDGSAVTTHGVETQI